LFGSYSTLLSPLSSTDTRQPAKYTRPQSRPAKLTHVCSLHSLQLTRANVSIMHTTPRYEMFRMMVQPTDREADNELTRRRAPDEKHVIDIEEEESVLSEQEQVLTMISSQCFLVPHTLVACFRRSIHLKRRNRFSLNKSKHIRSSLHVLFSHSLSSLLLLFQPSIFTLSTHSLRVPSFLYSLNPLSSHSLLYDNRFAKRCTNPT
jgi:hypothetical protein